MNATNEFDRGQVAQSAAWLAERGVRIGTSSWKYEGWCGQLYNPARYLRKGRFVESRFKNECLQEYANVFKTVCVDAAYYKFPDSSSLDRLAAQVPHDFQFAFKVTDEITVKRFPKLPRFGARAGTENPNFLNAELFSKAFLQVAEPFRSNIGLLIFEFSRFSPQDFARGREFMDRLDAFFASLASDWRYAVEIRNRGFLHPDYFAMLASHKVAHCYNSWTDMPSVSDQMSLPGSQTNHSFSAARFLLKPGRTYQTAVNRFGPYDQLKEVNPECRSAGAALIRRAIKNPGREESWIYVNNRLEGNALASIAAMIRHWRGEETLSVEETGV